MAAEDLQDQRGRHLTDVHAIERHALAQGRLRSLLEHATDLWLHGQGAAA